MRVEIKDSTLGPILRAVQASIVDNNLTLIVDHYNSGTIRPNDDMNETTSNAFLFIVGLFLKNNNIDFKPSGDFTSRNTKLIKNGWRFDIKGAPIDPMEYFIEQLT